MARTRNKYEDGGPKETKSKYKTRSQIRKDLVVPEGAKPEEVGELFKQAIFDEAKRFANDWYPERAKQDKYKPQLANGAMESMLGRINSAKYDTSTYGTEFSKAKHAFGYSGPENMREQAIGTELRKPGLGGAASPMDNVFWTKRLREGDIAHEGLGHIGGDLNPAIMKAVPWVGAGNNQYSDEYTRYVTSANERNAQTMDFRFSNRNLMDDEGNPYIDPNRQLTPEDMKKMRNKGAVIPDQWKDNSDDDIIKLHNTLASTNGANDPYGFNMAAYGGRLYAGGGILGALTGANKAMDASKIGGLLGGASGISGIAGGVASAASNAIAGGLSSGVGNAMQSIGSIASNIPGVGGLIGAGVNVLGGLVNRAFGSQMNEQFIADTKAQAAEAGQKQFDNSSIDSVIQQQQDQVDMGRVTKSQVGKDGWFSSKAKNMTAKLNKQIANTNTYNREKLGLALEGADEMQDLDLMANFAAYGGQLFNDGGGIHIKKANRGKFTEYCGGKVTSACIARGKHSSSPAVRKRATFADNARGWHHSFGGWLNTQGGDFSNGITMIGNGGTHEQNPFEGVQMGVDPQGVPNLVEEGEVVFNDYVFSNRLKVPKKDRKRLRLKEGTFADAAEKLQKESAERPNDPISKRGLESSMNRLAGIQEGMRERKNGNKFAEGGPYKTYKNYENVGQDWYTPDYMNFVNSLKEGDDGSQAWLKRINSGEFGPIGGNTFTDISDIRRLATDRKKGPVHNAMTKASERYATESKAPSRLDGTPVGPIAPESKWRKQEAPQPVAPEQQAETQQELLPTWMRYAPVIGAGMGVINDAFRKTDYSNADSIRGSYSSTPPIGFTPVNNKLTYNPLDTNYMINKLDANTAAQRRALIDTSGGNRATASANIIAANANYGNQMGDLFRQAQEYNQQQRERVEGFNRQTNMYNSEGKFKADASNQQSRQADNERRLRVASTTAQMRQNIADTDRARRDANITGLLQGLGDIGYENFGMNMVNTNPALYRGVNKDGSSYYKGNNKKKKGGRIIR